MSIDNIVFVQIATPDSPPIQTAELLPPPSFEERFEKDGKWLLGTRILGSICRHMKGKALVAVIADDGRYSMTGAKIDISLPAFPMVRDEISGKQASIYWTIPEELRPLVEACCLEVMSTRARDADLVHAQFAGSALTQQTVDRINCTLMSYENERIARGELELWQVLADRFGLCWFTLPPDAFAEVRAERKLASLDQEVS
jgi:hypothetical protein